MVQKVRCECIGSERAKQPDRDSANVSQHDEASQNCHGKSGGKHGERKNSFYTNVDAHFISRTTDLEQSLASQPFARAGHNRRNTLLRSR